MSKVYWIPLAVAILAIPRVALSETPPAPPPPSVTDAAIYKQLLSEANDRVVQANVAAAGLKAENDRLKSEIESLKKEKPNK